MHKLIKQFLKKKMDERWLRQFDNVLTLYLIVMVNKFLK